MSLAKLIGGLAPILVAGGLFTATGAQAQEVRGSCVGFDMSESDIKSEANPFGEGISAYVLNSDTPIYADEQGNPAQERLAIGEVVRVLTDGATYVKARREGGTDREFFVARRDISCNPTVLMSDETGLERKAVIRTETAKRGEGKPVTAYPRADLGGCDENCRQLSRFELYFIAADTDNSVLLSQTIRLGDTRNPTIVGWVAKDDIYEWPYSVGLRPREDLKFGDGPGTICGYLTLEEARAKDPSTCQPILGGPDWYKTASRLLVMREHPGGIYETVAPVAGIAADNTVVDSGGQLKVAVDPLDLRGAETGVLLAYNRVDLFFLIDGTKSMTPYIDAIRGDGSRPGVIQQIVSVLQNELSAGVTLRAGFRVFRDNDVQGKSSLGEAYPLPDQECAEMTEQDVETGLAAFEAAVAGIKVTTNDADDYPEDLRGGLEQALIDMRACPDNQKILVVISDAGYDEEAQRDRGVPIPDMSRFVDRMNGDLYRNSYMFFLRPPANDDLAGNEKYTGSFESYKSEALNVLGSLEFTAPELDVDGGPFFVQLGGEGYDGAGVAGVIMKLAAQGAQPRAISEIIIDLRGGASLRDSINRLRGEDENKDIPAYFWRLVERGACEQLGEACTKATYQSVRSVYINNEEDKLTLDVWMTQKQFDDWNVFLSTALSADSSVSDKRKSFGIGLEQALKTVIRQSVQDSGEPIGQYLSRVGHLPIGFKTPLMAYSLLDILEPSRVAACEISMLSDWLNASSQMLDIMVSGRDLPEFTTIEGDQSARCFNLSDKGKQIPVLGSTIQARPLPDNAHTLKRTDMYVPSYWLPQEYLP